MDESPKDKNIITKLTAIVKANQQEIILALAVSLITITSYNLGKISAFNSLKTPIKITQEGSEVADPALGTPEANKAQDPTVVASKNSKSKLYHFTWCSGASRIAAQNKISFPNEAAAIAAGYTLAGNCQK
jgi:hypothetical protein